MFVCDVRARAIVCLCTFLYEFVRRGGGGAESGGRGRRKRPKDGQTI